MRVKQTGKYTETINWKSRDVPRQTRVVETDGACSSGKLSFAELHSLAATAWEEVDVELLPEECWSWRTRVAYAVDGTKGCLCGSLEEPLQDRKYVTSRR